jgi:hypothetical protein
MATSAACLAQNQVTFSTVNSTSQASLHIYAVDVNNDGLPDIVQDQDQGTGFLVSINQGNGTFAAPVTYAAPGTSPQKPMAFGDFNGDGYQDIVVGIPGTATVAVYLGKGDGTFKSPIVSTLALETGQTLGESPLVTADFNHDGHTDLAVAGTNGNIENVVSTVYVVPGTGTGSFTTANAVFTNSAPYIGSATTIYGIVTGDFDNDGNADLAITTITENPDPGNVSNSALHVLFGNGDFGFTAEEPYNTNGALNVASGDINGDGITDLYALDDGDNQLDVFYGSYGRAFQLYTTPLPSYMLATGANEYTPFLVNADFNDDGHMDIAALGRDLLSGSNPGLAVAVFLGTSEQGVFTPQEIDIPSVGNTDVNTNIAVGDFNGDTKPDFVVSQGLSTTTANTATLQTEINGTAGGLWSNCPYPNLTRGIAICSPTATSPSSVTFSATGNSFGQIRKMEIWLDGSKVVEQHNVWEHNAFVTDDIFNISPGQHFATFYQEDIDGTLYSDAIQFTAGDIACSAPSSSSVNICSPADGSTSTPSGTPLSVLVQATAKVEGSLDRMEVWVDGVKKFTDTTSTTISANLPITRGTHQFTVYAVNTEGVKWDSTVTATVN